MNVPVLCDQCGAHLRIDADTNSKKFVAVCAECGAVYDLNSVELTDEAVSRIVARFALSDVGKTLSYMVKRA